MNPIQEETKIRLSIPERIEIVELYYKYKKISTLQREWKKIHLKTPPRKTISRIIRKFKKTGSVQDDHKKIQKDQQLQHQLKVQMKH